MAYAVHYVGGAKDGEIQRSATRPAECERVHTRHGRAPELYSLYLFEAPLSRSIFVYASSNMPFDAVSRTVAARLRSGEIEADACTADAPLSA